MNGRDEQYLHRAHLLLADDGDGRHHGTNQHQDEPHDAGHEVVYTLHLRIVEQLHFGLQQRDVHSGRQQFAGRSGDDARGIAGLHGGRVGVGSVGHQLHGGVARIEPVRKAGTEHHSHIHLRAAEGLIHLLRCMETGRKREVLRSVQPLDDAARQYVVRRVEYGHAHVLHLGGDGKAEQDNLHHRHHEQDEHRPAVAEDVAEFLTGKYEELFHFYQKLKKLEGVKGSYRPIVLHIASFHVVRSASRASRRNTSSIVAAWKVRFSPSGESRARIRPMRSQYSASSMKWVVTKTVMPRSAAW